MQRNGQFLVLCTVAGLLLSASSLLRAQAAVSGCPATRTLDEFIKAIDAAVSGPADGDRTCLRALAAPDAKLIPVAVTKDGEVKATPLSVEDWIERVKKRGSAVFYERQIKYTSETYGNIAHLWSTYEIRDTPDGKAEVRGINSIHAMYDGTQWKLVQILWQAETPSNLIPQKYLP
jgi:hypothetical protein